MKIKNAGIQIAKWLSQTVLFAMLPLIFYMLIHWMFQLQEEPTSRYITELCAFTSGVTPSVIMELSKKKYKNTNIKEIVLPVYLALAIMFFIMYGVIMFVFALDVPLKSEMVNNMFHFSLVVSLFHFVIALLLQFIGGFYGD
ncbi:MAG: hypothetical protein Q4E86_08895 [Lachnospiraceae bacterium]|nr:hypothetical protein [Lachnospiraceae bacterium]